MLQQTLRVRNNDKLKNSRSARALSLAGALARTRSRRPGVWRKTGVETKPALKILLSSTKARGGYVTRGTTEENLQPSKNEGCDLGLWQMMSSS